MDIKINALVASSILFFCCSASATNTTLNCKSQSTSDLYTSNTYTTQPVFQLTISGDQYTISSNIDNVSKTFTCGNNNIDVFNCNPSSVTIDGSIYAKFTSVAPAHEAVAGEASSSEFSDMSKNSDSSYKFYVTANNIGGTEYSANSLYICS